MRYTARFYNDEGALSSVEMFHQDEADDREAIAYMMSCDSFFNEATAGWTLHDEDGREIDPTDEDYARGGLARETWEGSGRFSRRAWAERMSA